MQKKNLIQKSGARVVLRASKFHRVKTQYNRARDKRAVERSL